MVGRFIETQKYPFLFYIYIYLAPRFSPCLCEGRPGKLQRGIHTRNFRTLGYTMENEAAKRRMHQIACHIAGSKDVRGGFLLPARCSGTMNSVIKRYDNMVLFARQGATSQGYFMRQVKIKQFPSISDGDMSQLDVPLEWTGKASATGGETTSATLTSRDPLFSRPVEFQQDTAGSFGIQRQQQPNVQSVERPPLFAKPVVGSDNTKDTTLFDGHLTDRQINTFNGLEWTPRMDVAESASAYVVTIELPGVSDSGIRVEVDDKSLIVTGKRSTEWWRDRNAKSISTPVYHRQELSRGPYRVVWQLPDNSNRDEVSAEFVDGFLQITILKQHQ